MWKDGTRRGIVYVEGKETAERVLLAAGRDEGKLRESAMAIYQDKRGKVFAWQIAFDIGRWDSVAAICHQ
jgi:hypothetical protein